VDETTATSLVRLYAEKQGIDLIITLWDAFATEFTKDLDTPVVKYVPVDGYGMDRKWANYLEDALWVVAMSEFGYGQLLRWFSPWRLALIPHGVDTATFRPIEDVPKELLRLQVRAVPPVPQDCFLALCVAANYGPRKNIPLLLWAWRRFVVGMGRGDAHLLLWTNPNAPAGRGYDLPMLVNHLGLKGHVHFPEVSPILAPLEDRHMAVLYNSADVVVSLSSAEGFGLPVLEAQACGTPVVATDCSSHTELVRGHGWLVRTVEPGRYRIYPVYVPYAGAWYPAPDVAHFLECLEEAYSDPDLRAKHGREARRFVERRYDWDRSVMPKWLGLLRRAEEELALLGVA